MTVWHSCSTRSLTVPWRGDRKRGAWVNIALTMVIICYSSATAISYRSVCPLADGSKFCLAITGTRFSGRLPASRLPKPCTAAFNDFFISKRCGRTGSPDMAVTYLVLPALRTQTHSTLTYLQRYTMTPLLPPPSCHSLHSAIPRHKRTFYTILITPYRRLDMHNVYFFTALPAYCRYLLPVRRLFALLRFTCTHRIATVNAGILHRLSY